MARSSSLQLHATTVALEGQAVVITGESGSGKSSLGLQLMALGAGLVADDRTILELFGGGLVATVPPAGRGLIEARGVGILRATPVAEARVALAVDLDRRETARLPPSRSVTWLGVDIPLIFGAKAPHFAPAVFQYLKAGRRA
ncbi:HPr kinase/phosphorylase [Histidinibacterium aquaticum]|uniref:Serine kinase n=1 Tax=Histidinibacterium aquaticum TaxID=2613962 RepID=A0A5J5GG32_9RHOB|nr:serine kinase [Histidinibacterium aquaticum]KAA9007091.1 serine kinase [Histidinibacterium aquaticum]